MQPKPSLSLSRFSIEAFLYFKRKNNHAVTEAEVMSTVFPVIKGSSNLHSGENRPFGNLAPLTDGTLVNTKPDFYDGSRPTQLDRRVRAELGPRITSSTELTAPPLPNFFAETKGPNGSATIVNRQACYDGALGAQAVYSIQSKSDVTIYGSNAYTITSIYSNSNLRLYTTHPASLINSEGFTEYHMAQLRGYDMTDTIETFRHGASAF